MIGIRKITFPFVFLVLVALVLAAMIGISLSNYVNQARLALSFRYPLDYGEGPLLDQTLRLASGENIYHNNFAAPPYTISNYPPLFLLVQVPFSQIFGPAFWYGRWISFISALLTALLICLTLQALTRDWLASIIGGLILLTFPYIQYWSLLNRIDTLALMLSWAALFVTVRWSDRHWGIPVAAVFFIASVYTRQTYALAAPASAFIWLLLMRRFRKAGELAAEVGGVGLGLFLIINLLTRGGFFLNIVTANVNPFFWHMVRDYMNELWKNAFYLILLIAVFLVVERARKHTVSWPMVLPYILAATASAVTVGKDGSSVNYMYELAAAIAFGTGAALAWFGRNYWVRTAVLLVLVMQLTLMVDWTHTFNGRITEKTDNESAIAHLYQIVQQTDGIVLTDEFMGLSPLAGKRLYYQPFEFKMLSQAGVWDQTPFLSDINNHKFSAILWYDPPTWSSIDARWTSAEKDAINSAYTMDTFIATTRILKPRK